MNPLQVLTPRGHTFFWLGLLTALLGMVLGYPDVTRLGLLITILPLCALLISRRRPPSLAVQRVAQPTRLHPDEPGLVQARFVNVGERTSALYLAEEQVDVRLGDRPRFLLPRMDPRE